MEDLKRRHADQQDAQDDVARAMPPAIRQDGDHLDEAYGTLIAAAAQLRRCLDDAGVPVVGEVKDSMLRGIRDVYLSHLDTLCCVRALRHQVALQLAAAAAEASSSSDPATPGSDG